MTAPRGRRRWLPVAAAVLTASLALLGLLPATPAWAHASLVASNPTQGAVLEQLPESVTFDFDQDMSTPAYVIVTSPDGSSATAGDPQVDGAEVTQRLDPGAVASSASSPGSWTMAFRVVSEDGHPVTGQIEFSVGEPSTDSADRPSPESATPAAGTSGASGPSGSDGSQQADLRTAQAGPTDGYWHRHGLATGIAAGLFVLAAALLALSRRAPA